MPEYISDHNGESRHSDAIQDIITTVPPWLSRCGTTVLFVVLTLMLSLSAFIRYPDIVKTSIKVISLNSPKPVVVKTAGKLVKLLVKENDYVEKGQVLAYLESTADHHAVLKLLDCLKTVQKNLNKKERFSEHILQQSDKNELGELQISYQTFFQSYLNFKSAVNDGFYQKKKAFLQKDLINLTKQREQLNSQKEIQHKEYMLAGQEYDMHQKLVKGQVETKAEFRDAESKYLSKKSPLIQTDASLLGATNSYNSKLKEILDLDNQISEEKSKFSQALNSLISQAEDWKSKYVLYAPQNGKISFAGIVEENEMLTLNQEAFYIKSNDEHFFGEMAIPQDNMGKVKEGQEVLIKLKAYPFEQYGIIQGRINHIANVPYRDSIFVSTVDFKLKSRAHMKNNIRLKQGMLASAEIVTQDATILQRITWNLVKLININGQIDN